MANTTFISPKPYDWQRKVLNDITSVKPGCGITFCIKSGRQRGKSFLCQLILLYYAINYSKTTSVFLSITQKMSRKVAKDIISMIGTNYDKVIKSWNSTTLEMELVNGSVIYFMSTEMKEALRGYTVTGILIEDECTFYTPDIVELIQPWTNVHRPPVLMVSTPKLKRGYFWDNYNYGLQGIHKHISYDWSKEDTSVLLSNEQKEIYKATMSKNIYKAEIEGEFIDDDGVLFTNINDCINDNIEVQPGSNIYLSIDWGGSGQDNTVITSIFKEDNKFKVLDSHIINDKTSLEQIEIIYNYIKSSKYKIKSVAAENNGLGGPLCDLLDERLRPLNIKLTKWNTTNKTKLEEVQYLQTLLEKNDIEFNSKQSQLLSELSTYEGTYNWKTNTITYNAPAGMHDDTVMSLLIGLDVIKTNNTYGSYCFG